MKQPFSVPRVALLGFRARSSNKTSTLAVEMPLNKAVRLLPK